MDFSTGVELISEAIDADFGYIGGRGLVLYGYQTEDYPQSELARIAEQIDQDTTPNGQVSATVAGYGEFHLVRFRFESGFSICFGRTTPFDADQEAFVAVIGQLISVARRTRTALRKERYSARHDALTGLANRASIKAYVTDRLSETDTEFLTVLFVDLDRFKMTNDTLGHRMGDIVLSLVADRLSAAVRAQDMVGRLSGDEFVVVCNGMSTELAIEFATRIQTEIQQPANLGGQEHVITASIGIAEACPGDTADLLVSNADIAMYRAKQQGRSRIEVFDASLRTEFERRVSVEQDLRRGIAENELSVRLQPLVVLASREVVGFEALVRWEHPTRGVVLPGEFIGLAEESGIVGDIDRTVIKKSLEMLTGWDHKVPISFNLSSKTFVDPLLTVWLSEQISHYGIHADLLKFELTETALMDELSSIVSHVEALRSLGSSVLVDDFGTGYSPLTHLQTFNLDGVKIDQGFVSRLGRDRAAAAIVGAVMYMACSMGLDVIAEGIETNEQAKILLEIAAGAGDLNVYGQGYLFGRPMLPADAAKIAQRLKVFQTSR